MWKLHALVVFGAVVLGGCVEERTFRPADGFELRVPSDLLRLNGDGQLAIPVSIVRGAARIEDIELNVSGLPAGVTAEPSTIAAGTDATQLVLRASGAALHTQAALTITASGNKLDVDATVNVFIAGRPGDVDASYGTSGSMSLPVFVSRAVALRSGATIVIGDPSAQRLVKLNADGGVDESFGNGGYVTPSFYNGMRQEQVSSLFIVEQADGKLLLVTALDDLSNTDRPDALSVSRLMPNGTLDQSYGNQGHAVDPFPNRPYAAALGIDGELLLWNGSGGTRLTRITSNGAVGTSSSLLDGSAILHTPSEMIVQTDGKAVVPVYEAGLKPALLRFDTSLRLDPTFGQGGKLALSMGAFTVKRAPAGGYVSAFRTPDPSMPAVIRFDDAWRPMNGFESGGVAFPFTGFFLDGVALDGATYGVSMVNNAVRIGRVLDRGMIDSTYGVDGLATVAPLSTGDFSRAVTVTTKFGLLVFVSRNASQSTEVIRVWQ